MEKDTTVVPESSCPVCHHALDRATDATGKGNRPGPGDLTVCINCASVLKFDEAMHNVKVSDEELSALDPDCRAYVERLRHTIRLVNDRETHTQR